MDEETVEFNVAHNRKYSTDHLWYQEKDDRLMIGVSEFLRLEIGDVLRVILPQAETEVDEGDGMFSIWTAEEKKPFPAPFSGLIAEVNGEVEINPWWRLEAILTCKSIVGFEYRGERLIELSSSWFISKFPSG